MGEQTLTFQIEYGLLCNAAETPVAVEVFEGDRGMIAQTRIDEELRSIKTVDLKVRLNQSQYREVQNTHAPPHNVLGKQEAHTKIEEIEGRYGKSRFLESDFISRGGYISDPLRLLKAAAPLDK